MGNPTAHVIDDDATVRDAVQLLGGEDIEVGPYAARVRHATIAQVFGD